MTEEQVLINHIQEYLDSGMWQDEACYLNRSDLKVIIKALEQKSILDKIRVEINGKYRITFKDTPKDDWVVRWNDCLDEVLQIIDKYRESEEV